METMTTADSRYYIKIDGVWKPTTMYSTFEAPVQAVYIDVEGYPRPRISNRPDFLPTCTNSTYTVRTEAPDEPSIPIYWLEAKIAEMRNDKDTMLSYIANEIEEMIREWQDGEK